MALFEKKKSLVCSTPGTSPQHRRTRCTKIYACTLDLSLAHRLNFSLKGAFKQAQHMIAGNHFYGRKNTPDIETNPRLMETKMVNLSSKDNTPVPLWPFLMRIITQGVNANLGRPRKFP